MNSTPLLLTPRQAAAALATSERTLWSLTQPRGPIPVVRFGRSVRYSATTLAAWIARAERRPAGGETGEPSKDHPRHAAEHGGTAP
jgi:excisionase family DNA binding protein